MKKSTACFLVFAIIWEIAVGLLYGFFLRYSTNSFKSMASPQVLYPLPINPTTSVNVQVNSTQFPFPQAVVVIAIFLLIVGTHLFIQVSPWSLVTSNAPPLQVWPLHSSFSHSPHKTSISIGSSGIGLPSMIQIHPLILADNTMRRSITSTLVTAINILMPTLLPLSLMQ